ncbi:MAG: hypothetical protein M0007_02790 [Actinomycetota bacterium]|nr:hypothetical protein [Actinomycetota bacterium]
MPGTYRIAARTGPDAQSRIAVGGAFPWWTRDWLAWLALALMWASAIALIILPIVFTRRRSQAL